MRIKYTTKIYLKQGFEDSEKLEFLFRDLIRDLEREVFGFDIVFDIDHRNFFDRSIYLITSGFGC